MKTLVVLFLGITLLSCDTPQKTKEENKAICDCKELQHDPDYNVLHLGDRLKPFTGQCLDYYLGGKLKKDFSLKDGKYHGTLFYYHKNGQLQSTATYEEGLIFGDKKVYDETGALLFHGIYKRSRLLETVYNHRVPSDTTSP